MFSIKTVLVMVVFVFYSSDGRVVSARASKAVDSGWIPSRVKPMTFKLIFPSFLLDAQHIKEQCGEQPGKFTCTVEKGT